jgi:ABC-type lipoprotein export system ATPase subunit
MIKLNNINKYFYHKKPNQLHVLKNIDLTFKDKGLVVILGESGSGKSTLLNIIGGLDSPTIGSVVFEDYTFNKYVSHKWDQFRNEHIAFVYQDFLLNEELSVYENIELSLKMQGRLEVEENINKVTTYLGINAYLNSKANALSGGERQRVAIARALAKNPDVLIADEPTGNLDSKNTIEIMNIIRSIADEKLVILVTHEESIASLYANRIIRLKDGEIIDDKQNDVSQLLNINEEQIIYLKELDENKGKIDQVDITLYKENDAFNDLDVKLIEKNQTLYMKVDNSSFRNVKVIDKYSEIELIDDYYKPKKYKKVVDVLTTKEFHQKQSTISFKDAFKYAKRKIDKVHYGGKMLYFSLALIGAVIAVSIGLLGEIFSYTDADFIETNRNYVNVTTPDLNYNQLIGFEDFTYIDKVNIFNEPIDFILETESYYEVRNPILFKAHPTDYHLLEEDNLIYGRLPQNDYEVVIDLFLVEDFFLFHNDRGMDSYEDILTSNILLQAYGLPSDYKEDTKLEFRVVGISNDQSPTIYISDSLVYSLTMSSIVDINIFGDDFELMTGRLPNSEFELLLHEDSSLIRQGNIPTKVGIGSGEYNVVGTYRVIKDGVYNNMQNLMATRLDIMKSAYFYQTDYDFSRTEFLVYTDDVELTITRLQNMGVNASSKYLNDYETYKTFTFTNSFGLFIFSIAGLIISGISIVFVMRSILPSRTKELSVYRALGAPKKDIVKLFATEIFVTTTISSLLGFITSIIFLLIVQNQVSSYVEILYYNVITVMLGILVMYVINILFGILPVLFLLRKTPAEIIKRHDI